MKGKKASLLVISSIVASSLVVGYSSWIVSSVDFFGGEVSSTSADKVAYIQNFKTGKFRYFTSIEGALKKAAGGEMVAAIPPSDPKYLPGVNNNSTSGKYYSVTYTIRKNCEIKPGVTFVVPYEDITKSVTSTDALTAYIDTIKKDQRSSFDSYSKRYTSKFATENTKYFLRSTINVSSNVTITNSGTFIVPGMISGGNNGGSCGQTGFAYSRLVMGKDSKIVQKEATAKTYLTGYIEEEEKNNSSRVKVTKGELYMPLVIRDYRGFSATVCIGAGGGLDNGVFVAQELEARNLEPILEFHSEASMYALVNFWIYYTSSSPSLTQDQLGHDDSKFMGSSSSYCFEMASGSYMIAKYDKDSQVMDTDFYGGFTFHPFSLTISRYSISTQKTYFPLSYHFDVSLNGDGASYSTTNQNFKLLPGSKVMLGEGASLNAKNIFVYSAYGDKTIGTNVSYTNEITDSYSSKYDGGKFYLNGLLTATGLAGEVIKSSSGSYSASSTNLNCNESMSAVIQSQKYESSFVYRETVNEYSDTEISSLVPLYVGINNYSSNSNYAGFDIVVNPGESFEKTYNFTNGYQMTIYLKPTDKYKLKLNNNVYIINKSKNGTITKYVKDETLSISSYNRVFVSSSGMNISGTQHDVSSVVITSNTPTIAINGVDKNAALVGNTIELKATILNSDKKEGYTYTKDVTWKIEDSSIATISDGVVTGVKSGITYVTATADGIVSDRFEIVILDELPSNYVAITDVTLNGDTEVTDVKAHKYSISVLPNNANISTVKWLIFQGGNAGPNYTTENNSSSVSGKNMVEIEIDDNSTYINVTWGDAGKTADKCYVKVVVSDHFGHTFEQQLNVNVNNGCVIKGTLITMADGSFRKIEDLKPGEFILSYDFETGKYISIPAAEVTNHGENVYDVLRLHFDDESSIGIIQGHGFFDVTLKKYVDIDENNYKQYIGHEFMRCIEGRTMIAKLVNGEISVEKTCSYSLLAAVTINAIADGFVTITPPITDWYNMFKVGDDLKWDEDKKREDIERYGLFEYDEVKDIVPYEIFVASNFKYFKVAFAKGLLTMEDVKRFLEWYRSLERNGEIKLGI